MPAPAALPVLFGGLKFAGKAAPLVSKLLQGGALGGALVGAPAAAVNYIANLPRKEMERAVAAGPDPATGSYESRVNPLLRPFVKEEDRNAMGIRRAAYLNRVDGDVKRRAALIGEKLQPGEEADDFIIRTQEAADLKKLDKDIFRKEKLSEIESPEIKLMKQKIGLMGDQIRDARTESEGRLGLMGDQLKEQTSARLAADTAAAQGRLDAINSQAAQLEYQKGRDAADMRRFELLLERDDRKEAQRRTQALIQGLSQLGGAMFN